MADNTDVNKKLDKIEAQLNAVSASLSKASARHQGDVNFGPHFSLANSRNEDIELRELFSFLWKGKWWIAGITFLFAVAGGLYALSLPDMYKSEGVYAPEQRQGGNPFDGQLGGLATLAGVRLGSGSSNEVDQAMALFESWQFLEEVIRINNLKPYLFAVKGWSSSDKSLEWDLNLYDPESRTWRQDYLREKGEPSDYDAYRKLEDLISFEFDAKSSLLKVSVEHFSPEIAKGLVETLVSMLDDKFRSKDVSEATKNVAFLESKIRETSIAEMQKVFYGMIEAQMQKLMLAEMSEGYLWREVVEPKVAEKRSSPNVKLILALAMTLGLIFSLCGVVLLGLVKLG